MKENEEFFRTCWLRLKAESMVARKKKLLEVMNEIECTSGGIKFTRPSPKKKSEENQDDGKPDEDEFVRC